MADVFLVRHGQAAFGTEDYDRLTALGWEQSAQLGHYFAARELRFDAVRTGTLRRHRETLAGIAEQLPALTEAEILPELDEYDFDDLVDNWRAAQAEPVPPPQGARAFYRLLKKALLQWSAGELPGVRLQWSEFEGRARDTLGRLAPPDSERVLVISSGGAISALLREVLELSPANMINLNLQAANTGITRLISRGETHRLASFNCVPHLDQPDTRHLISYT